MTGKLQARGTSGDYLGEGEWGRLGQIGLCWSPGPPVQLEFYQKRPLRAKWRLHACMCDVCICVWTEVWVTKPISLGVQLPLAGNNQYLIIRSYPLTSWGWRWISTLAKIKLIWLFELRQSGVWDLLWGRDHREKKNHSSDRRVGG